MNSYQQTLEDLIVGETMAVAYSGFREGQHPDRGEGAVLPSREEVLEDLTILVDHGFNLIRLYDSQQNSIDTLEIIRDNNLPIKVLLGVWLEAEISNHEGCPWLEEPIPEEKLASNKIKNQHEVERGIQLSNKFSNIIVAINVGNEALVDWNDHMVPVDNVIAYVKQIKAKIKQPVTVADNYEWWIKKGKKLAAELDFIGVHTYPAWEEKTIDQALSYTIENIQAVHAALPGSQIAILEAGWATTAVEFGERANPADQKRYYNEIKQWAEKTSTTVFFFEAFDEPWKGDSDSPNGAEKHWGLFYVDRSPKAVMIDQAQ